MTPSEWEACRDPLPMLEFLRGRATARQYRLFAVACCRRVWHVMTEPRCRQMVDLTEAYADRRVWRSELEEAGYKAATSGMIVDSSGPGVDAAYAASYLAGVHLLPARNGLDEVAVEDQYDERAIQVALHTAAAVSDYPYKPGVYPSVTEVAARAAGERAAQASLVRCIFRHPSEVSTPEPSWRTSDVRAIASAIYEDRAFDRLPILADALIDAGCTDEELLAHCRLQEPHARGCWVVGLILRRG